MGASWFIQRIRVWSSRLQHLYKSQDICVRLTWLIYINVLVVSSASVCDVTYSYVWHDVFVCVTLRIRMLDMTRLYVWHDSFSRSLCACRVLSTYMWHDSFMCDVTQPYAWHDLFVRVTWLIRTCHMTHSCAWHDSFVWMTWLIRICDMTQSWSVCARRVSSIFWHKQTEIDLCHTHEYVMWHDSFSVCVCSSRLWHLFACQHIFVRVT